MLVYDDATDTVSKLPYWTHVRAGTLMSIDGGRTWEILVSEIPPPETRRWFRKCPVLLLPLPAPITPQDIRGDPGKRLHVFSLCAPIVREVEQWAVKTIEKAGASDSLQATALLPAGIYRMREPDINTWRWISPINDATEKRYSGGTEAAGDTREFLDLWQPGDVSFCLLPWQLHGDSYERAYHFGVVKRVVVTETDHVQRAEVEVDMLPEKYRPRGTYPRRWADVKRSIAEFLALPLEQRVGNAEKGGAP